MSSATATRRYDPARRDRIIDACLDVIAENGVAGTSHRKVALAADVPLGSMTYHFSGMEQLLHEAFSRFAHTVSDRLDQRMSLVHDSTTAKQALADHVTSDLLSGPRDLVLTHELYTLAARKPAYRDITNAWMARSRQALERHFTPATARILDALVEGLSIHRALDNEPHDPTIVTDAIERVTSAGAPTGRRRPARRGPGPR
jgi:TetR/AcrR family transcriptional regulator, regulator of biofilm formation and stress response